MFMNLIEKKVREGSSRYYMNPYHSKWLQNIHICDKFVKYIPNINVIDKDTNTHRLSWDRMNLYIVSSSLNSPS